MQVVVQGLLINYARQGTGRQVLVLHGWGDSSLGWGRFVHNLSEHYDVIVPDLPGFGGSQMPPVAWGLSEYAIFVANFVAKLQLQPSVIIGHSNGGAIAIRGLSMSKLSADKLVLIAAAGIRGEYKGRTKALRLLTKTGKLLAAPLPNSTKRRLRRKVYKTVGSDMLVSESLQETFKKVVEDDVRADAGRLDLPTLLVYGERDVQTPVSFGLKLHELMSNSTLEIVPEADHFAYQSHEAEVLKLVEEFVS